MASDDKGNTNIEDEYTRLILQNREWVKEKTDSDPLFFDRLVNGQCTPALSGALFRPYYYPQWRDMFLSLIYCLGSVFDS